MADLLQGDYKQSGYDRVILLFTVLQRLDCILERTKATVFKEAEAGRPNPLLLRAAGLSFLNRSPLVLGKLAADQDNTGTNLLPYILSTCDPSAMAKRVRPRPKHSL